MKQILKNLILPASLLICIACGTNQKEAVDKPVSEVTTDEAEEKNDEQLDDTSLEKDSDFAVKAAEGGLLEVQFGALAQKNASSNHVKQFAQHMIAEHSTANEELKQIAQQRNIILPTNISSNKQERFEDLSKRTGQEFDKEYIEFMVKDHEEDIELFEKEAERGKDSVIRAWAAGKLARLHEHHRMARATRDAIKADTDAK